MLPTPPVTEFAILRLKPGHTLADTELAQTLRRGGDEQSAWSTFPVYRYTFTRDGPHICILSQWDSVPAHQAWIDSAPNQALLALLGPKLDIASFCHIALKGDLERVLGAETLSWSKGAEEVQSGDACGRAVDTPDPTFYAFQIGEGSEDAGWTTMSRLEL